ncbi:hypothetical protein DFH11DRAFT_863934 [Phellopilus nigrolimitatus]|nr:hypothetical protein DFH11DRAFT_863934 [Phellopilus nigrolimitatus]
MLQIAKAKTHIIFTDTSHNAGHAVRANMYQAFVLAAMKMHAYTRAAGRGPGSGGLAFALGGGASAGHAEGGRGLDGRKTARTSGAFLLGVIRQSIRYTYASIKNKASGKLARQAGSRCDITKDEVVWLGTHAFHSVLSIKRTVYTHAGVLGALRTDLERARFRGLRRKLKGIARESLEKMLRDIPF